MFHKKFHSNRENGYFGKQWITRWNGLRWLLRQKWFSKKEIQHFLNIITLDFSIYTMIHPNFILHVCCFKENAIGLKKVKASICISKVSVLKCILQLSSILSIVSDRLIYQLTLILTALLHADLISVGYLTACVFTRSWCSCTFWMTSPMTLNRHKNLDWFPSLIKLHFRYAYT